MEPVQRKEQNGPGVFFFFFSLQKLLSFVPNVHVDLNSVQCSIFTFIHWYEAAFICFLHSTSPNRLNRTVWVQSQSRVQFAGCKWGAPLRFLGDLVDTKNEQCFFVFLLLLLVNNTRKQFTRNLKCRTYLPLHCCFLFKSRYLQYHIAPGIQKLTAHREQLEKVSLQKLHSVWSDTLSIRFRENQKLFSRELGQAQRRSQVLSKKVLSHIKSSLQSRQGKSESSLESLVLSKHISSLSPGQMSSSMKAILKSILVKSSLAKTGCFKTCQSQSQVSKIKSKSSPVIKTRLVKANLESSLQTCQSKTNKVTQHMNVFLSNMSTVFIT